MSKRHEIRARRRRERIRNRIFAILLITAGALLIVFAVVIPMLKGQGNQAVVTPITPRNTDIPMSGTSMGDPNAPVKMDVWEDFQCPTCRTYSMQIEPLIFTNYVETGKVFYTFHFYPLFESTAAGGTESTQSANAALCAAEQDRFWDYHDILFANWAGENVGAFSDVRLVKFAENLNLDMVAFNQCFEESRYQSQIQSDKADGLALEVTSTPSIFVNRQIVLNPRGENILPTYEDIAAVIESALAGE